MKKIIEKIKEKFTTKIEKAEIQNSLTIINTKKDFFYNITKKVFKIITICLFPIVLFIAMEILNGMGEDTINILKDLFSNELTLKNIMNALFYFNRIFFETKWISMLIVIAGFLGTYGIVGKLKRSMIVTTIICMILAIVNYMLLEIRGTSITPTDFYSIGMVYGMKDNIKIKLSFEIVLSIGLIAIWIVICSKIRIKEISQNRKKVLRITSIGLCIAFFITFFETNVFGVELTYNTKMFYREKGIATSFLTTLKSMKLKEPEGYSIEKIKKEIEKDDKSTKSFKKEKSPNIVVIMNESFSDLANLYNLNISEDNMPFIHSLKENTIKAKVHSSSLGGKTANCEWEFLTGNTSRFLPVGAVTYQLYVKQHVISLIDTLNARGYYTSAYHPYKAEGYNRNIVYQLMGFDEYKFEDDLENLNYLRYDFVDDISTYKNIIKLFERKEKGQKIFNFTVTMQNHLSYNDRSFENNVFLKDYNDEIHFDVNQYLSLVKKSDEAFEYIVNYFRNYDEPTLIMMFGDHQPNLVENYPEVFGKTAEENDENKYIVPMVLWANYDIQEKNLGDISMNYLSNVLLATAKVEKTYYMKYLEKLYKKYPVITTNVYQDSNGVFNRYETIPEEFKIYEYIQYNNMFDKEKVNELYE